MPDFMSLSQFQLRPEKQIESMFTQIVRDDGFVYADDLLEMVGNIKLMDKFYLTLLCSFPLDMKRRECIM